MRLSSLLARGVTARFDRLAILVSLLSTLTCLVCAMPELASAQETPAAKAATAKEAFKRGEAAYSAGNYDAAVREWNNAYAADPRPRIQFNLSQAYERMGRMEDAIASLKRFLESGDPEDPTYSDANARLVALQQRLSATGVTIQGGREGGSILVDDQDWGRTPRPDKITVAPGNHVLVVRWPDNKEFRTNVFVPAGQVVELQLPTDGQPATATTTPATTAPVATGDGYRPPPDDGTKKKKILWYSLGAGTAALGTGLLIYGIVRGGADSDCGSLKGDYRVYCNPDSVDSIKAQSLAGYISGAALLAGGAAFFVVGALTTRHSDAPRAATRCGVGYGSATCKFEF
ncbi:MAG TPA: tetratricopeptide repeat protein [Polyangiales bacterium]|nr:tetratricopeptide repeat protein [Polyangiales bacterium]